MRCNSLKCVIIFVVRKQVLCHYFNELSFFVVYKANYYITIPTTIVQDPPNNFESKTVNVSGGSLGLTSILMLLGLIGFRRFKA
ncbi:GlyGly-CTERM sorting domain-containing protein [Acinetobacter junii]|uniref:GlyGly-CTERM sorting domain-containing protein n=1 Tax=Acinetobacter junii TaxID=40215 RepID=A0A8F6MHW0_ACIJU|nr:GlyGly-CTERM sorting domain-containing protein [Acinetobacter junii]